MPALVTFLLITLPWLNPFSPGPTASVVPLLFTWFCAAVLLGLCALTPLRFAGDRLARAIALAWLAAALLSAVMGLLQYFGVAAALGGWISRAELGVAFANLRQRNQFATLMQIGLLALLWWARFGSAERAEPSGGAAVVSRWRVAMASLPALLLMAALLGAGNAASSSRTGLVQLVLVAGLVLLWRQWRFTYVRWVMLTVAVTYVAATLALPWLAGLDPLTSGAWARLRAGDAACSGRMTLWGNVLHLIAQKPWLGWGWGELDYAHFITLYPGARFCDILDNAHNLPLHLAVVLGVPAALLVCGTVLWLVWRARPWCEVNAARQLAWGVLAVIGLHSLLEYPLWYGPFQVAGVLCVWLLWRPSFGGEFKRFGVMGHASKALLAIVLVIFVSYVAWDYHRIRQIFLVPAQRAEAYQTDTLQKAQGSWLFQQQVRFAALTTTRLTPANAAQVNELAKASLHFSPESRVVEALIDSAALQGRDDEVAFYTARYQAAFPEAYARWAKGALPPSAR